MSRTHPGRRRQLRSAAGCLLIATVVAAIWLSVDELTRQSDLRIFLRAGNQVLHGIDPYTPTADPRLWSGSSFVYPWLSAFLFAPLALLPVPVALLAFYLLSTAATVGGCRLLGLTSPVATCALLVAAPVLRNSELGAVNALFFFAGAALWRWRTRAAVVALAVVALVGTKLFLAPLVLWVLLTRGRRCTLITVASLAVFFVVSFLAGPISLATYIRSMALLSEHESLKGMSLRHLCRLAWPGSEAIVPVLVVVVLLIAVVLLHRRGAPEQVLFVGCLSAGLALTPILWTHYLFIGLLALMVIRPEPVWTTAASAGTWFLVSAAHIPTIASLSLALRLTMLWLLILLLPALALTARSNRPVVISPDPDQELEALLLSAQRADADVVMS